MSKIEAIRAREVLDSRGNPTVMATVIGEGGVSGTAMVPSGASTGVHEAVELRDGDKKRYGGRGVLKAVDNIHREIQAALLEKDTANQQKIDRILLELDGTTNKSRLGANAMLAVSLACARVEATTQGLPLYMYLQQLYPKKSLTMPVPQMNLVNGGRHSSSGLSIQEYHVLPVGLPSFAEALRAGVEIYQALREILVQEGYRTEVGDEAGFAPAVKGSEVVFLWLVRAIEMAGYVPGVDAVLGIDAAASEFFDKEKNNYQLDGGVLAEQDLGYQYKVWGERYHLVSVEDPFAEDAWEAWINFSQRYGRALQVVGDDLYATKVERIREGIVRGAANAVLIKPNQIGTLSETLQAVLTAQEVGHNVIVSHRSGETEDTFIADLAVAVGAGQIKTGAPARGERTAKYNRLLAIAEESQAPLGTSLAPYLKK
jgi:enolase